MEHPDHSQNGQVTSNFLIRSFQRLLEAVASHAPLCQLRYTQSKALLVQSSPQVMPMLQDLLIWVWFSWGKGELRQGQDLQLGHAKTNKKRHQTVRAPSSSAVFLDRRKVAKFCASLHRLLARCKFTMLMTCIISINVISLAVETSCRWCWVPFLR